MKDIVFEREGIEKGKTGRESRAVFLGKELEVPFPAAEI